MLKGFLQTKVGQVVFGVMLAVSWLWFLALLSWAVIHGQIALTTIITAALPALAAFGGGAGAHYITTINSNGKSNGNGNGSSNGSNGSGGH